MALPCSRSHSLIVPLAAPPTTTSSCTSKHTLEIADVCPDKDSSAFGRPSAQTLTLRSSPPVASTLKDRRPSETHCTLPECAANS